MSRSGRERAKEEEDTINNNILQRPETFRDLGIIFDKKLEFNIQYSIPLSLRLCMGYS